MSKCLVCGDTTNQVCRKCDVDSLVYCCRQCIKEPAMLEHWRSHAQMSALQDSLTEMNVGGPYKYDFNLTPEENQLREEEERRQTPDLTLRAMIKNILFANGFKKKTFMRGTVFYRLTDIPAVGFYKQHEQFFLLCTTFENISIITHPPYRTKIRDPRTFVGKEKSYGSVEELRNDIAKVLDGVDLLKAIRNRSQNTYYRSYFSTARNTLYEFQKIEDLPAPGSLPTYELVKRVVSKSTTLDSNMWTSTKVFFRLNFAPMVIYVKPMGKLVVETEETIYTYWMKGPYKVTYESVVELESPMKTFETYQDMYQDIWKVIRVDLN